MASWGNFAVFTNTIAVGGSITTGYDLGGGWGNVFLAIPTMTAYCVTATCNIYIQAGDSLAGTYFTCVHPAINSSTTGIVTFTIANSAKNSLIPIPNGFRYLKVQTSNSMTAAVAFSVFCGV